MWYNLTEDLKIEKVDDIGQLNRTSRSIKRDTISNYTISTVFLYLDHSFNSDVPILFETLVFLDSGEDIVLMENYQLRYETYIQACMGHNAIVKLLKKKLGDLDNKNNNKQNKKKT